MNKFTIFILLSAAMIITLAVTAVVAVQQTQACSLAVAYIKNGTSCQACKLFEEMGMLITRP